MFLCFYLAIFKLTSAKFQSFAYNSRAASSWFVPKLEVINHVVNDFGFRTWKPPRKISVKSGVIKNGLCKEKIFHIVTVYALRYLFIPTNPLMAAMSFFLFIFLLRRNLSFVLCCPLVVCVLIVWLTLVLFMICQVAGSDASFSH